jgi:hypothetical protein
MNQISELNKKWNQIIFIKFPLSILPRLKNIVVEIHWLPAEVWVQNWDQLVSINYAYYLDQHVC